MLKLTTGLFLTLAALSASYTGYRVLSPTPIAASASSSANPYETEAALRHRQGLPNHWRGFVLQSRH